jgi:acyl carrier protein
MPMITNLNNRGPDRMNLNEELKKIIVKDLFLEDITWDQIEDDAPLFGDGLGLDSLDAVELVVIIQKHFDVEIKDMDEGRIAFQSINSLASFIRERQTS